ncbi:UNKNOWN [Stylonychia lemnae]|uniref:Wd-40 repeat protein n=1 Tax=Stylonychia lemnae TaxID=5949 RepID=A0A078BAR2_STYLE|nr:UNKNOWN [Stylonychia lemnae]|eukprot:CDW90342.1 UNKNOWN [Stylonychia lemnae]
MIFRISAGDFSTDNYRDQSQYLVILTWLVWIIAVLTLNIVFMNFIIAVISESYERVMQKLVAETYRVKANMIVEREQLFSETELKKEELFPQYILIRKQISNESNDAGEWQGFIKDLKYTIRTTVTKSKGDIIQNMHTSLGKIDEGIQQNQKLIDLNENLGDQINKIKQQLDQNSENSKQVSLLFKDDFTRNNQQIQEKIESQLGEKGYIISRINSIEITQERFSSKVEKLQEDMDFIKSTLAQLLQKQTQ